MSSVEGMWALLSASVWNPNLQQDGGVVVLESGRVFGGDSVMAYVGRYEVKGEEIIADVRSWNWHPSATGVSVFGVALPADYQVTMAGRRTADNEIQAEISMKQAPGQKLTMVMRKIAELP